MSLSYWEYPQTEGLETVLLVIFTFIYPLTLLGNLLILLAIVSSSTLPPPMYFFLGLLSNFGHAVPFCLLSQDAILSLARAWAISYKGCAVQLFFYHFWGSTEGCLYSVMACHSLCCHLSPTMRYMLILETWSLCWFGLGCLVASKLSSCHRPDSFVFQLPYCGPNKWTTSSVTFLLSYPWLVLIAPWPREWVPVCWLSGFNVLVVCLCLLHTHWNCHFEDPFCRGQAESFLYLQCPPHCHSLCLWTCNH